MNNSLFNPYLFWEEDYTSHEAEFIDFIRYVPLSEEHEDVWSLKLANLLLLIGSSIDSFFKCSMTSLRTSMIYDYLEVSDFSGRVGYIPEEFKTISNLHEILLRDVKPNMGLYREFFEIFYSLSSKDVYVLRTKEKITPFIEWAEGKSPEWWRVYRDLKHSRFEYRKSATLKNVLDSLAALFLLNIYHIDSRKYLVDKNVIRSNMKLDENFINSRDPNTFGQPIIAKTNILGYVWDRNSFYGQHPWTILDPGNVYRL